MAYANYKCIEDVIEKFNLRLHTGKVTGSAKNAPLMSDYFLREMEYSLRTFRIGRSEIATYSISNLPQLNQALHSVFQDCLDSALKFPIHI